MKFATLALIPLFAGFLAAQTDPQTQSSTTTTTTTVTGTLVDQGCYTTRTKNTETSGNTTTETTKVVTECPITTTTTSFGLLTPEGKFIRFDDSGNTRVVEMMKTNKGWHDEISNKKPVKVRVIGTPNGDVMIIKEIK